MIGRTTGRPVSITGLGCYVPSRIVTNDDLAEIVDTSDEWIATRTGIRERRIAAETEAMSDLAIPAARAALAQAGVKPRDLDLIIVATITPDMMFPATAALVADALGSSDAAAYDLSAGCTGFMYALAQAHATISAGSRAARSSSAATSSRARSTGRTARRSCSSATAPAPSCSSTSTRAGSSGSSSAPTAPAGASCTIPGSGSRLPENGDREFLQMNGREVFKFATRVLVSSAEAVLEHCGLTVDDVDVYVPHQANVRIIDHAVRKLGFPEEKVVINVDRYGNTSSGSIPLALADAARDGRLRPGSLVLMTGMGAGLTWGSALMRWTQPTNGATE